MKKAPLLSVMRLNFLLYPTAEVGRFKYFAGFVQYVVLRDVILKVRFSRSVTKRDIGDMRGGK